MANLRLVPNHCLPNMYTVYKLNNFFWPTSHYIFWRLRWKTQQISTTSANNLNFREGISKEHSHCQIPFMRSTMGVSKLTPPRGGLWGWGRFQKFQMHYLFFQICEINTWICQLSFNIIHFMVKNVWHGHKTIFNPIGWAK